jgi:metallo-beta-lactamase class B
MQRNLMFIFRLLILALGLVGAFAQTNPDWNTAFPPFRIVGNLYYVGNKDLASYLITTAQGNILINSDMESNVPMIQASIEKLGFKFKDTMVLLISHAHFDHAAGSAKIKELTGAAYMVMEGDVPVVESGGKADFQYGNTPDPFIRPPK